LPSKIQNIHCSRPTPTNKPPPSEIAAPRPANAAILPVPLVSCLGSAVVERCEYDAYGNCHILEPNFAPDPDGESDYSNPYLFTGRTVDIVDNSSLKIQYNRNRYCDHYTGRWTTHDPLGYGDGMNLYEYVSANPLNSLDPRGSTMVPIDIWPEPPLPPTFVAVLPPEVFPPARCPPEVLQMAIALDLLARGYSIEEVAAMTGLPVEKVRSLYLELQWALRQNALWWRAVGKGILQQLASNLEARQHARGPLEPGGPRPPGGRPPRDSLWLIELIANSLSQAPVAPQDLGEVALRTGEMAIEERNLRELAVRSGGGMTDMITDEDAEAFAQGTARTRNRERDV
jgi:RHS repeat-associated protein